MIITILILLIGYILCTLSWLLFRIKPKFYNRLLFYAFLIITGLLLFSHPNKNALNNITMLILFIIYVSVCELSAKLIYKYNYVKKRIKKESIND